MIIKPAVKSPKPIVYLTNAEKGGVNEET